MFEKNIHLLFNSIIWNERKIYNIDKFLFRYSREIKKNRLHDAINSSWITNEVLRYVSWPYVVWGYTFYVIYGDITNKCTVSLYHIQLCVASYYAPT